MKSTDDHRPRKPRVLATAIVAVAALPSATALAMPAGNATGHSRGTAGGTAPATHLPPLELLPRTFHSRIAAGTSGSANRSMGDSSGTLLIVPSITSSVVTAASASTLVIRLGHLIRVDDAAPAPPAPAATPRRLQASPADTTVGSVDQVQSLSSLTVASGDTVQFLAAPTTRNLIVRVTGGQPATIDGTVQTRLSTDTAQPTTATLFLLDPSGIIITSNTSLDLAGSFGATTADSVTLADGLTVNTAAGAPPTTAGTAPSAPLFTFTAAQPAAIAIGSSAAPGPDLALAEGKIFTAVAGSISLDKTEIDAAGGRVNLIAVGAPGAVGLDPASLTTAPGLALSPTLGAVSISDGSLIRLDGTGGGRLSVRGGTLTLANSSISAQTLGSSNGLGVDIIVSGSLTSTDSSIITDTAGAGDGGAIAIDAGSAIFSGLDTNQFSLDARALAGATGSSGGIVLQSSGGVQLLNGAFVSTGTRGVGYGGDIAITCGSLLIRDDDAGLFATAHDQGNAGNISVDAQGDITINDDNAGSGTAISTDSYSTNPGGGRAGDISISCASLSVLDGGKIGASTVGTGNAGDINIHVGGAVTLDGGTASAFTGIGTDTESAAANSGNSGNISLTSGSLSLMNGAEIESSTFGPGKAGTIGVAVLGDCSLNGSSGSNNTGIFSQSANSATGSAGSVTLSANTLELQAGAEIGSDTNASGNAGAVTVSVAGQATLDGGTSSNYTGISAESNMEGIGGGAGGTVLVACGSLHLTDGAAIGSFTLGTGAAGTVNVSVAGDLKLDDNNGNGTTSISSDSGDGTSAVTGSAGTVVVSARTLELSPTTYISSDTYGTGNAGSVYVMISGRVTIDGGDNDYYTGISAESDATTPGGGQGGDIHITAGSLLLINGAQIDTATYGTGMAGNVVIHVQGDLTVNDENSGEDTSIFSDSGQSGAGAGGAAGQVVVSADTLHILAGGSITSDAYGTGNAGDLTIAARSLQIDGDQSLLASESGGPSAAGGINITAGTVALSNGGGVSAAAFAAAEHGGDVVIRSAGNITVTGQSAVSALAGGTGGDVALTAHDLIELDNSQVTAQAGGAGGRISIDPVVVLLNGGSVINGLSAGKPQPLNIDGDLLVAFGSRVLSDRPDFSIDSTVANSVGRLNTAITAPGTILAPACGVDFGNAEISSFVVTGRGAAPVEPGDWVPALIPTVEEKPASTTQIGGRRSRSPATAPSVPQLDVPAAATSATAEPPAAAQVRSHRQIK